MTQLRHRFPGNRPGSWLATRGPGTKVLLILGPFFLIGFYLLLQPRPRDVESYQDSLARECRELYAKATTVAQAAAVDLTHPFSGGGSRRGSVTEPLSCGEIRARGWIDSLVAKTAPLR